MQHCHRDYRFSPAFSLAFEYLQLIGSANCQSDMYFSKSYEEARSRFREAAAAARWQLFSLPHPSRRAGDGTALTIDVAVRSQPDTRRVLLSGSATHGVEGFLGSAGQIAILQEGLLDQAPAGVGAVLIHAINPYGFSAIRRANEDNVDCNRNFVDFTQPRPVNAEYEALHPALIPADWDGPSRAAADEVIDRFIRARGFKRFYSVLSAGQYSRSDGLFYGGSKPVWSNQMLRGIFRRFLRDLDEVAWVDLHSGLGEYGYGETIYLGRASDAPFARVATWYGQVTSTVDGTSIGAPLTGAIVRALNEELPGTRISPIALEFGTQPQEQMVAALRAENWLHLHGDPLDPSWKAIKQQLRNAFYVDEDRWRDVVIKRIIEITRQALHGLGQP